MNEEHTLKELMEDLQLQTELHDKETLKKRREDARREKELKDERKRNRKRVSRVPETEEERLLRKYPQLSVNPTD